MTCHCHCSLSLPPPPAGLIEAIGSISVCPRVHRSTSSTLQSSDTETSWRLCRQDQCSKPSLCRPQGPAARSVKWQQCIISYLPQMCSFWDNSALPSLQEGKYFSEEQMRSREPLLYEQYIGQYLTDEEVMIPRVSSHVWLTQLYFRGFL